MDYLKVIKYIQLSSCAVSAIILFAAIFSGYRTIEFSDEERQTFRERAQALADLKFTYVVSCQIYGAQKKSSEQRDRSCYNNILNLMLT